MPFFPPARTLADPDRPRSRDVRPRFVTTCQQLLVLGVIVAALTPAAGVVSIDFAPSPDADGAGGGDTAAGTLPALSMTAYEKAQTVPTLVPTTVVDPVVREVALTTASHGQVSRRALDSSRSVGVTGQEIISAPQDVTGYGAVGLTWKHGEVVPDGEITAQVRLLDDGAWSDWTPMDYHDDHGPDPDSEEARRARPGTDELLVGDVDQVQVKVTTTHAAPADLKLAVIDPGVPAGTAEELPSIDTNTLEEPAAPAEPVEPVEPADPAVPVEPATPADPTTPVEPTTPAEPAEPIAPAEPTAPADAPAATPPSAGTLPSSAGDLQLSAAAYTRKPVIYSRAQWGADEKLRDKSSLHYFEVHAGFVHHTVNANNYKASDVPAILRGIYAYHTQSKGWSDVGYNFLVDRFGRIWEGRYGGVDRPVVGAHTLGYNDDSFAMSAIGNFEETKPTNAMVQAYGALFGWKLALHGVKASSTKQYVTKKYFKAINGHRDAGSTACPGKYLYDKIPQIRTLAKQAQVSFSGRQLESNVVAGDPPDLLARRASDGQGYVIPLRRVNGKVVRGTAIAMKVNLSSMDRIFNAGDWDRDGRSDMITRIASSGNLYFRPGRGNGRFGDAVRIGKFKGVGLLAAVGDMTGDGWPDLMGQPVKGDMRIYPGRGTKGFKPSYVAYSGLKGTNQIPVGLWDGDGAPDSLVRNGSKLILYPGNGPGGLTGARTLPFDTKPYDKIMGVSDIDLTGHPDLIARRRSTGTLVFIAGSSTKLASPKAIGVGYGKYDLFG